MYFVSSPICAVILFLIVLPGQSGQEKNETNLNITKETDAIKNNSLTVTSQEEEEEDEEEVQPNFIQLDEPRNFYDRPLAKSALGEDVYLGPVSGTTGFPMSLFIVKWSFIFVAVLVPLIMFPVLFLFTQSRAEEGNAISDHRLAEEEEVGDICPINPLPVMRNLSRPMVLLPTIPERDTFLNDQINLQSSDKSLQGLIQIDPTRGQRYYHLEEDTSLVSCKSGQLYHPPSGLVFNPIQEFVFQPEQSVNVHILSSGTGEAQPNQVYSPDTNKLYERCLALGYNTQLDQFFLPRQPQPAGTDRVAIRRVEPHELPPMIEPSLYTDKLKRLASDPPPVVQNPLLVSKRDFSKLQQLDLARTPRGKSQDIAPQH